MSKPVFWLGAACAIGLLIVLAVMSGTMHQPDHGTIQADRRKTVSIAQRAVAVAESGSRLSWRHLEDDRIQVRQSAGNVFYRVDPGGSFEVLTPSGTIKVLGTCFRVEVYDMKINKKILTSAALASAATAMVFVVVFEGQVLLSSPQGDIQVGPGHGATLAAGTAPRPFDELRPMEPDATGTDEAPVHQKRFHALEEQVHKQDQIIAHLRRQLDQAQAKQAVQANTKLRLPRQFEQEPRDEVWAGTQEEKLHKALVRYARLDESLVATECRQNCCHVQLGIEELDEYYRVVVDLKSHVGLGIGSQGWQDLQTLDPRKSQDGLSHIYVCQDRTQSQQNVPDRGMEREVLLKNAQPALDECARKLTVPLSIQMYIYIDIHGAISKVDTTARPAGEPVAQCVEQAILTAAQFAPSTEFSWIPVRIQLFPLSRNTPR